MAARKKNPEVKTQPFSASIPKYQVDAIYDKMEEGNGHQYPTQSSVIRAAIDSFLKLDRPPEFISTATQKPKAKPKAKPNK